MNTLYIQPRQSGKTTDLIESFNCRVVNNLLIVNSLHMKHNMLSNFFDNRFESQILTVPQVCDPRRWRGIEFDVKRIFVDEYLFFSEHDKKELYTFYQKCRKHCVQWEIRTTSNMLYNRNLLDLANEIKHAPNPEIILDKLQLDVKNEIERYYWYNFLTEPDFNIIRESKNNLKLDQYRLEILGELLK